MVTKCKVKQTQAAEPIWFYNRLNTTTTNNNNIKLYLHFSKLVLQGSAVQTF